MFSFYNVILGQISHRGWCSGWIPVLREISVCSGSQKKPLRNIHKRLTKTVHPLLSWAQPQGAALSLCSPWWPPWGAVAACAHPQPLKGHLWQLSATQSTRGNFKPQATSCKAANFMRKNVFLWEAGSPTDYPILRRKEY